jgi:hypothetical protein
MTSANPAHASASDTPEKTANRIAASMMMQMVDAKTALASLRGSRMVSDERNTVPDDMRSHAARGRPRPAADRGAHFAELRVRVSEVVCRTESPCTDDGGVSTTPPYT